MIIHSSDKVLDKFEEQEALGGGKTGADALDEVLKVASYVLLKAALVYVFGQDL